jgi:hypothetical protein
MLIVVLYISLSFVGILIAGAILAMAVIGLFTPAGPIVRPQGFEVQLDEKTGVENAGQSGPAEK